MQTQGGRMLKRTKKMVKDKAALTDGISEEEKRLLVPSSVSGAESTVIGKHIFIEGSISGAEHLVIDGTMKGSIELKKHNFSIGSKGRFEGEIDAQNVSISGEVNGDVKTPGKVQITKEADFIGEIKANTISVEDGAYFKGAIELQRKPNRQKTKTTHPDPAGARQPAKDPDPSTVKEAKKGT
jgi:cytoskeletal protein CcmA (bactofilin family)